jgi:hypothetical protein
VVVEDRGAARQGELRKPGAGGGVLGLGVDSRPDRIELAEPGEEVGLLRARPRERLVQVVMGVDQPRGDQCASEVDAIVGGRRVGAAERLDQSVPHEDPPAVELRLLVVHAHDVRVCQQEAHAGLP